MDRLFKQYKFKDMDRMGSKIQVEEYLIFWHHEKKGIEEKRIQLYLKVCERCGVISYAMFPTLLMQWNKTEKVEEFTGNTECLAYLHHYQFGSTED